jgi:hypothetical protein
LMIWISTKIKSSKIMKILFTSVLFFAFLTCFGQQNKISDFKVVNRTFSIINDKNEVSIIYLNEVNDDGKACIKGAKFTNGSIEFNIKGKDVSLPERRTPCNMFRVQNVIGQDYGPNFPINMSNH